MYIEQWTYYRAREQSVCNNAPSEVIQNNLHSERTIRAVDIITGQENNQCVTMLIGR